jgi:DNA segregation ATPase FtsK/SpoIIIE, S-DNA-T family
MAAVIEERKMGMREFISVGFWFFSLFFLITLLTFNQEDGGWTHSGMSAMPKNAGGIIGAWISDFTFSLFGFEAFLFPLIIAWHGYSFYKQGQRNHSGLAITLRWLGLLITFVAGTVIFYLHVPRLPIDFPNGSGGILGQEAGDALLALLSESNTTALSSSVFLLGLSFFIGFSWFALIDKIGNATLWFLTSTARLAFTGKITPSAEPSNNTTDSVKKKNSSSKPKITTYNQSVAKNKKNSPAVLDKLKKATSKKTESIIYSKALPSLSLLDKRTVNVKGYSQADLENMSVLVETVLSDFNVSVKVVAIYPGPVITRFELELAPGVKVSRISGLTKDIARGLSVTRVRVVDVIQGKSVIGLEIPNREREMVALSELLTSSIFTEAQSSLTLALGKDIAGVPVVADLAKMPHVLVAGTTGSGKSVAINTMILSMLYKATPEQIRMIMIDPKMLELSVYEGIPHLLTPVVTDMKEASNALRWAVAEMERRYKLMSKCGVRNLAGFNQLIIDSQAQGKSIPDPLFQATDDNSEPSELETLPHIVIVIDELADMMMIVGKKVEELIARLAQKARASGIHLILATQRPSVDVLTGLIKANIPTRISFQVSSRIDSRTILDQGGAEALLGNGDMLYLPSGTSIPIRAHGAFVDDHEVHRVVDFLKKTAPVNYLTDILQETSDASMGFSLAGSSSDAADAIYDQAVAFVIQSRKASISSVQRRFKIGYNRAARMIEDMETAGIISAPEHNGSRTVIAPALMED